MHNWSQGPHGFCKGLGEILVPVACDSQSGETVKEVEVKFDRGITLYL